MTSDADCYDDGAVVVGVGGDDDVRANSKAAVVEARQ